MTTDRIALLRPVNTAALTDALVAGIPSGTHVHCDVAAGTHWSLLSILDSVRTQLRTVFTHAEIYITSSTDYKVQIDFGEDGVHLISPSAAFTAMTGLHQGTLQTHTATTRSPYVWVSTYSPADQVTWTIPQADVWAGSVALDGNLAGTLMAEYSSTNYDASSIMMSRPVTLSYESAEQTFWKSGGTQSIEKFMMDARSATSYGNADTACTGFFMYENADDISTQARWTGVQAVHGILTSSNKCQFCSVSPQGTGRLTSAVPAGKSHYNVNFTVRAARPNTSMNGYEIPS